VLTDRLWPRAAAQDGVDGQPGWAAEEIEAQARSVSEPRDEPQAEEVK